MRLASRARRCPHAVVLAATVALAAGACGSGGSGSGSDTRAGATTTAPSPTPSASPTDDPAACPPVPPRRVATMRDGTMLFSVLDVQWPIRSIIGTHAEFVPKGQFARVRVAVVNPDSVFHPLDTDLQRLTDSTGAVHQVSTDGMRIKRQPQKVDIGSQNRLEFDLWFEVPEGASPRVLTVRADGCGRGVILPRPHT